MYSIQLNKKKDNVTKRAFCRNSTSSWRSCGPNTACGTCGSGTWVNQKRPDSSGAKSRSGNEPGTTRRKSGTREEYTAFGYLPTG